MMRVEALAFTFVGLVLIGVFWKPFVNGLVTLEHDIFSRARFVPYDPKHPETGYAIHMSGSSSPSRPASTRAPRSMNVGYR